MTKKLLICALLLTTSACASGPSLQMTRSSLTVPSFPPPPPGGMNPPGPSILEEIKGWLGSPASNSSMPESGAKSTGPH